MDQYRVDQIRADYVALSNVCYLNTGTVGVMSESVLSDHLARIAQYERFGHFGENDAKCGYEDARHEFARTINAEPAEIALNRNATDGINFVLAGLDHQPGTSLLTTDEEHPAVMLPISRAAQAAGGEVQILSLSGSDDEILDTLRTGVSRGDVSLAILSHVSCESGRRLPIQEMCAICQEHGVLTLVDGAQSVGQIDVDVRSIGCDFMAGNGHKWLCGPKGTGFLYIRSDRVELLTPPYAGDGAVEPRFDRLGFDPNASPLAWSFRKDAQRFEFGTRNWHLYGAAADSIRKLREIGTSAIQQHVASLSSELKLELKSRDQITVHTPERWSDSSGMVTFSTEGWNGTDLSERLWNDYDIIQRRVQVPNGVRISCAHYNNREDLQTFLSALDKLI